MIEKRFRVQEHCLRSSYGIEAENWLVTNDNHIVVLNDKAEAHMVANMCNDVIDVLNTFHEEKETYKRLFNEMAYYFRNNIKSLNDLDHKDFESLQLLARGEYFDEESLSWCKVQLEEIE